MTITYRVGNGLYVNMTNRCTSDCVFCIRKLGDSVGDADSLWLDREPSREEVLEDILKRNFNEFDEIVFCGYGEPTMRLDDMLWVCKHLKGYCRHLEGTSNHLKSTCPLPIRVNTNGHASLVAGYDTAPLFSKLVDKLSISLNAASADEYVRLCKPEFGTDAYQGVLDFARNVKAYVPDVVLTVVHGTTDVEPCRSIAEEMGLKFRVR